MATTHIEADIKNITGVETANAQFVISAQKFVVSSIPKDLMWMYAKATAGVESNPVTNNSTITNTDSILAIKRGDFTAKQYSYEMRGFINNSSSLYKATNTYPKYIIDDNNEILVFPAPDSVDEGKAIYVSYANVDDDSDLRNAVVFHACSSEFTKLASFTTFPTMSWVFSSSPVVPASPNFTTPGIATVTAGGLGTVPTFTPPVMSPPDWSDTDTWINAEEDSEMLSARVQEIQAKVGEYGARIQESQAIFNKENSIYQSTVQEALQELQVNAQKAQQETNLLLQKETQEYAADIQAFQSDLQKYQADVNKIITGNQAEAQEWQIENSKFVAYVQESTRYYQWAQSTVQSYIQNNSKMINRTIEAQAAQQQRN